MIWRFLDAAIELARADSAFVQGQVRRAVPVTRPQPPPQAVITLQVSPLAFWTKAQIVYALLAPEAHCAQPAFETVTAVVALPSKEHAPQVAVSGVTGDGGVLKYPIAVNWYAPLAGAVADVGLTVTDWAVRVADVPQAVFFQTFKSSASTESIVGKWRAISRQFSPSSKLAKTEPLLVPK